MIKKSFIFNFWLEWLVCQIQSLPSTNVLKHTDRLMKLKHTLCLMNSSGAVLIQQRDVHLEAAIEYAVRWASEQYHEQLDYHVEHVHPADYFDGVRKGKLIKPDTNLMSMFWQSSNFRPRKYVKLICKCTVDQRFWKQLEFVINNLILSFYLCDIL